MDQYQNPHYDVVIATPGSQMESAYVVSLINTIKFLNQNGISWTFLSKANSNVSIAREWTILSPMTDSPAPIFTGPLNGTITYNKIFMIDSDMYWEIEDFMSLYQSNEEFISGVYFQSNGVDTVTFDRKNHVMNYEDILSQTTNFESFSTGLGFVCLKSGVLESIERPWFENSKEERPYGINESYLDIYSEDISFTEKVKSLGYRIVINPAVKVGHVKKIHMSW